MLRHGPHDLLMRPDTVHHYESSEIGVAPVADKAGSDYKRLIFSPARERRISRAYLYLSNDSNERVPVRARHCIEGDEQPFSLNVVPGGCCRAVFNYSGIIRS